MDNNKINFHRISLRLMLELMTEDATTIPINYDNQYKFYWMDGDGELHEIVECDLLRGRFITDNQDFSEFEWELEDSHIYMKG